MSTRPNVVWVSFEDCSPRFGCYGDPVARTPNLDRLAAEGALWTKAFTTAPVCAPSRSAVITGMHPVTLGTHHMRTNVGAHHGGKGIPRYEAVIPHYVRCFTEYLRAAGYFCTNRNKTDYQFIPPITAWDLPGGHWRDRPDPDQPFFSVFNLDDTHEMAGWEGSFFGDNDIDLDRIEVPPYFPDTPKVRKSLARVYAAIEHNDRLLGDLLSELDEDGLSDSTAVFVWTDHGPLPRGKRWPYDSGIHSPLIVRWPGMIEQGTVSDNLVSTMDLGPTVLSICGVEVPRHMHGHPFLGPEAHGGRDYVFVSRDRYDEMYDMVRASRDQRFKYIRHYDPAKPYMMWNSFRNNHPIMQEMWRLYAAGELEGPPAQAMADRRPAEELYDTEADPHEIENLAGDPAHRDVLERHRAALEQWQRDVGDLGMVPEDMMVAQMWPGGVQPVTDAPKFIVLGAEHHGTEASPEGGTFKGPVVLQMQSSTQGASIGYTFEGEPLPDPPADLDAQFSAVLGHNPQGGDPPRRLLYHEPLRLPVGETRIRAFAHRIGYQRSAESVATFLVE
ncbi:MAG: sulfatase-like hydrolase/transferase [Acidimicrobiia bacterium]|nr:sulfatase-like hydrolase/transferase [Acidimicrobiia bacterium]MYB10348.1 sulfatase-like hydrolase/transferase [Acidimicrobiia bacterium]MYG58905.1 sulfatase-like hydrolase/transferase [Acidimicrobiia bacterium]MYG72301.1 sulfatase-like hydrolase/transferase [Acidimicrobiia bacterium]MYJ33609.1 sulfatase-like hydrolase/transferase [Acidimicrobiia bacterium]